MNTDDIIIKINGECFAIIEFLEKQGRMHRRKYDVELADTYFTRASAIRDFRENIILPLLAGVRRENRNKKGLVVTDQ